MFNFQKGEKNYTIREFTHEDTDIVYDFFQSLSIRSKFYFRPHDFDRATAEHLTGEDVENPDTCRFILSTFEGDKEIMAGYALLWDWSTDTPWFGHCIADAYQGMGLGRELAQFGIREARQKDKKEILVSIFNTNQRSINLTYKLGYILVGDYYDKRQLFKLVL